MQKQRAISSFNQAMSESIELRELKEIELRPYILSERSVVDKVKFFWQLKMRGFTFFFLAFFAMLASVLIILGELAILFEIKTNMLPKLVRTDLGFFVTNVS